MAEFASKGVGNAALTTGIIGTAGWALNGGLANLLGSSTGGGNDLLQTQEVAVLRSLLQTISNPRQDIPLIAALASPVFCITADELAKLVNGEKTPEESFAEGILMLEGDIDAAQELIKLVKAPAKKSASKPATKKAPAKKTVIAEKAIVEDTKKKGSKVAKDIKK